MELLNDVCSTTAIGCGVDDITSHNGLHIGGDMIYVLLLGTSLLSYGVTLDSKDKIKKIDNKLFGKMKNAANMTLLIGLIIIIIITIIITITITIL